MPRNREFDEDLVLRSATRTFREKGFVGTSVRDLENATGLTTGSLYNSYGGKAGLFEQALKHYNDSVVLGRLARHLRSRKSPRKELEALFLSTFEGKDSDGLGCLLTTASVEAQALSENARALLHEGTQAQRQAFVVALRRVSKLSEVEQRERAELLLVAYHGLLTMVRRGEPRKGLRSATMSIMNVVFS